VHETVTVSGAIADIGGSIEHHSYDDWRSCRDKLMFYAARGADQARRDGRRSGPLDVLARPPLRLLGLCLRQGGVRDGAHGLAVCAVGSAHVLLKYLDLWADPGGARPRT